MKTLSVRDLTLTHPESETPAVNRVSFDVAAGEIYALIGPSGAGKTTVLRLLAGFENVEAGFISMRGETLSRPGRTVPPEKRDFGFVFQEFALFPHLSVLENVCFGIRRRDAVAVATNLLRRMRIEPLASRMPSRLSGGEQQRAALARSLAPAPPLILLDEPFSSLDADLRGIIRGEVRDYLRDHGMAAVIVTHDQEEALAFADRIGVMRAGRIVQQGPAENLYTSPESAYVAQFLGGCNVLDGEAYGEFAKTAIGEITLSKPASGSVRIALRPEHLSLASWEPVRGEAGRDSVADGNGRESIAGRVLRRDFHGHDITFVIRVNGADLTVKGDYDAPWREGDDVRLVLREKGIVVEG